LLNRGEKNIRLAGILCGLLLVSIWAVNIVLESRYSQDFLLTLLHDEIPGHLSVEKLGINLFTGRLDIDGLRLQGPENQELVRVKSLGGNWSWAGLLVGQIHLSSVVVESPELTVQVLKDGSLDLLSAFVPPGPSQTGDSPGGLPFNIVVSEFILNKGVISFKLPEKDLSLWVSGVDILMSDVNLLALQGQLRAGFETGKITRRGKPPVLLTSSRIQAKVEDGGVSGILVQAGADGLDLTLTGSIQDVLNLPFFDITLESKMALESLARVAGAASIVPKGEGTLDLSVLGTLDNPEVTGNIHCDALGFKADTFRDVNLQWKMKDRQVTILPSGGASRMGNLSLTGTIDLGQGFPNGFGKPFDLDQIAYTLGATIEEMQLSALLGTVPGAQGRLITRINLKGTGIDPERMKADLTAELTATGLKSGGIEGAVDAGLSLEMGLDKHIASIQSVRLTGPGISLTGHGQLDISDMAISGTLDLGADDIGRLTSLTNVKGKGSVQATADIDGSVSSPIVSLSVLGSHLGFNAFALGDLRLKAGLYDRMVKAEMTGQNFSYNQARIKEVTARMGFSNGVLDIETFEISHGNSLITGSGRADILDAELTPVADPGIELSLKGNSVLLEDFFPDLTGHLSINGQVKGKLSHLTGSVTMDGNTLVMGGQTIDRISSQILFKNRILEIARMEIQVSPDAMVTAIGQVSPMDQTVDLHLDSKNFDLTRLNLVENAGVDEGRMGLKIAARGSFQNPKVKGEINIRNLVILKEKQGPMDFLVEVNNRQLTVKGNLGPALEGTYDLDTRAFSAALDMAGLSLSPYFKLAGQPQLSGTITGRIRAEGRANALDRMRASADFSKIAIAQGDKPFLRIHKAGVIVENGRLFLPSTRIELLEKGSFTVEGTGAIDGGLDFKGQGEIPLEIINPLVQGIESATGLIRVSASLGGTIAVPAIQGEVLFDGVGMSMAEIEQDFTAVEGRIKLAPDKIEILGVKGNLGQGRFDLGGSLGLDVWAVNTIDLELNAHQLNLSIPDLMDISLNGGLKLSGTDAASQLTGEIVLLEGRYYKDIELNLISTATERTREVAPLNDKKPPDFLKNIGLNVNIRRREPMLVDNNLAYLEISPDLTIKGTGATPLLAGRAQVDSGHINFRRAQFEVKKGVIDFLNPYTIEPALDIEGETQIRDWTITLAVSGAPDNLKFHLSSSPTEPDADILSLIAFGKTTRELRASDGGGGGFSQGILTGMVADPLQKNLKDSTGLDYLEINANETGTGSSRVNVTVGTDLSRQMTVKYGADVRNGETVYRVTTDYKLLEQLLMSGYQDTGGNFGGELKYRLEFR